ncbi:unnamed protein product [Rhizoctonia solani]|uniref:Zn(2)-C6 fungal-type domain-containing protein n=1 Tax=Rhizoctonia solani TaxID=456999 RepID=A0A8H3A8X1_9AGAM|nr:unnamed protein product [Rhizoctonia solani]
MSRSGVRCATCVARQRKCDGAQPICRHCIRDGVECGGYPTSNKLTRGLTGSKKPPLPPLASPVDITDLPAHSMPSWISNVSSSEPGTPSDSSNVDVPSSSPETYVTSTGQSSQSFFRIDDTLRLVPSHIPTPPYPPIRVPPLNKVSHRFTPPQRDLRESMTPGQASLFDALFSLARPGDDLRGSSFFYQNLPDPVTPRPFDSSNDGRSQTMGPHDQSDPEDSHDAQGVAVKLWVPLVLDKKVKSNTLPFVLQSYALWMQQFLFEPVRIIPVARVYTHDEYSEGPEARWRMITTSNAVRAITGSTEYTLEDLETLQLHMHQGFSRAASSFGADRQTDMMKALLAMSTTYEVTAISLKVLSLSNIIKLMKAIAPIFRRACPDPEDRQVNLPTLLSNINIPLEHYAILDIVLSAILNRPMYFRYDTTFPTGVYESTFNIENGPGLRWTNGIPDRLVITLARMNALLEEFGPDVDPKILQELEMEIKGFKSVIIASTDPSLAAGRLVVQESWRQAAFIYLYMGLCGADSHDARVIKAHDEFMELLTRTKPGRIPDSFLTLPLPIGSQLVTLRTKNY